MPKGQPDFGLYAPTETIVGLSDMGELAARLKSIATHDRRGSIIWLDDFESGIEQWVLAGIGANRSLAWVSTYHRSGGFCAKLTSAATTDQPATMTTALVYPALSKIGAEFSFLRDTTLSQLTITLAIVSATTTTTVLIRWTAATNLWEVTDASLTWRSLSPTISFNKDYPLFNTIKIVADFATTKFVRLIANNITYDLSGYNIHTTAVGADARMRLVIQITPNADYATHLYVDDVIVTQNEP